ncbi:hypothetical protein DPMN_164543 [Dreissena polymorpha]|uniref:B box-type domain-containing protein n=1 Tax=Dreissena polymorpha TaxID=45954 RepID=A0A9D4EV97_DREPO|nr:hypothetical protein DPMN_164543 [Dreissena polymorpha]
MAGRTNPCATFRDGSDIVLDYCSYVSEQNGIQMEAAHYCEQCSKCYCDICVPLHDQMFKTHVLIGREEMQRWPISRATVDALTQRREHNNETITAFCEDHSALCCVKCLTLKHR